MHLYEFTHKINIRKNLPSLRYFWNVVKIFTRFHIILYFSVICEMDVVIVFYVETFLKTVSVLYLTYSATFGKKMFFFLRKHWNRRENNLKCCYIYIRIRKYAQSRLERELKIDHNIIINLEVIINDNQLIY